MSVSEGAEPPLVLPAPQGPTGDGTAWVERTRLLARLSTQARTPVVLVSAPAGSGKSTFLDQWSRLDGRACVTISATVWLDDPALLARALVDSFARIGPPASDARTGVTGQEPGWSATVLPGLARLAATRLCDYLLVVDDVHLLQGAACHAALAAVADAVPDGSRLVLATREEAPRYLARARAAGRLLEIEPDDLAFDLDEAATLFDRLDVTRSDDELAEAVERAEGWAVGLYLHALSMRGHGTGGPRDGGPSRRGRDGFVFDYIGTQVLDGLDPRTRHFLTRTAALDELRPAVCDAILDRQDSVAVLPELCDHLQLVIPVDDSGQRFRYHHLLRDALLSELTREAPTELVDLHRRAALWFDEAGDLDQAVRHARATHDGRLLADIIWPAVPDCLTSGSLERLAGWLRGISEHDLQQEPRLTTATAWLALQQGDPERMDRWLLHAENLAGRDWREHARTDEVTASLACAEAVVGRGGLADSIALCDAALSGLPPDSGFRSAAAFVRGVCLTLLRDLPAGLAGLGAAEGLARALGQPLLVADSLSWQGLLAVASGDQRRGTELVLEARSLIGDHQLERLATSAHCVTALALVLALNHDPSAVRVLGTARRLTAGTDGIAPWFAVCGRLVQARAAVALGDGSLARRLISEATTHLTPDLRDTLVSDFLAEAQSALAMLSVEGVSAAALSPAEIRVLQFLPSHLTIPQIGEHLCLSPHTVKSHTLAIYRKLGVCSRDESVERAQRLGLVEAPPRD
ncbi:LuxR C-terminal-related transcriptional regulator [Cellulomonas soli]|uniref:helix-turn-helix transcriptional regulator n=1 Tax=Cellulomonas soli TaxID=931535 RepID=UPI003F86F7B8